MAPDFTLTATAGGKVKLSDFRGKNNGRPGLFPGRFHRWLNEGNDWRTRLVSLNLMQPKPRFLESVRTTLLPKKNSPPRTTSQFPLLSDFAKREVQGLRCVDRRQREWRTDPRS